MIVFGSRGDVQPVIALALRLKDLGCQVKMLVSDCFGNKDFVRSFLLDCDVFPAVFAEDSGADSSREDFTVRGCITKFMPQLLLYPNRFAALAYLIEKESSVCTIEYNFHRDASLIYQQLDQVKFRSNNLGKLLGRAINEGICLSHVQKRAGRDRPVLYAVSRELVTCPKDWPEPTATTGIHLTGYWTLDEQSQTDSHAKFGHFFGADQRYELTRFFERHASKGVIYT